MGRPATLIGVLAAATLAVASAITTATVVPAEDAPIPSAIGVSDSAIDFVAAAGAADVAVAPAVDINTAVHATRALRGPLSHQAAVPETCMTMKEFKRHMENTKKIMKKAGVAAVDIAAFERTILKGYKKFIVRTVGNKFCFHSDRWAEWLVKVYLDAKDGKLRS